MQSSYYLENIFKFIFKNLVEIANYIISQYSSILVNNKMCRFFTFTFYQK